MKNKTKPKCSLLATKEGWRVRDAAGMMFTITEIDACGYRWCECTLGRNKYLQKFTVAGDALIATGDKYDHAVKVFPPRKQKAIVSVVEDDGEAFPSTASELEPIIERLEEAKDQAGKMASLLREARVMVEGTTIRMPRWTSPQYGPQDPLGAHSLLVRIDAALQEVSAPRQASNAKADPAAVVGGSASSALLGANNQPEK